MSTKLPGGGRVTARKRRRSIITKGRRTVRRPKPKPTPPSCRVCGCTDNRACITEHGTCRWIEPNLCSACAVTPERVGDLMVRLEVVEHALVNALDKIEQLLAHKARKDSPQQRERERYVRMATRWISRCRSKADLTARWISERKTRQQLGELTNAQLQRLREALMCRHDMLDRKELNARLLEARRRNR